MALISADDNLQSTKPDQKSKAIVAAVVVDLVADVVVIAGVPVVATAADAETNINFCSEIRL